MYSGDLFEEKDTDKNSLRKSPLPAFAKDVASSEEPSDIPLEKSPPSSNGYQQREPSFSSKQFPSDIKKVATDSSTASPDANRLPTSSKSKVTVHFHDAELTQDLLSAVHADQDSANATHARLLNGFFSVLALCHTVLTSVDKETGKIEYKAQSPDESALVQAAADMGFVFKGREKDSVLVLQTPFSFANVGGPGEDDEIDGRKNAESQSSSSGSGENATGGEGALERYELLDILEFTSARKRMSVVLRKLDGDDTRLFLLSKGADNVIFERLKPGTGEELKNITEKHLDEFASQGLRTLTLAYKVIGGEFLLSMILWTLWLIIVIIVAEDEYNAWSERYHEATVAIDDREAKIEAVSDELERDLRLLGATAIEDRLQDGVPETIADLKRAGIKIWVATGDKLETAIGMYIY